MSSRDGSRSANCTRSRAQKKIILSTLNIVTINATTWQSFKKWLMHQDTLPDLIALQEHKLIDKEAINEASAFLNRQGFASVWGQGVKGPTKNLLQE